MAIAPASPRTNETLSATVAARDADGDALTYAYQWTRNGSDIAGATAPTLDLSIAGNGDRGDTIAFRVTVSDATHTTVARSQPVVVADTAPALSVALDPASPTTQTVLVAATSASDADGDSLFFTYVWKVNGVIRQTTATTARTDSFNLGRPGNGNKGDVVSVDVTASDGSLSAASSATTTIAGGRLH